MAELMRTSVRLGLRRRFPEELKVLTEVFDQALVETYAQMHAGVLKNGWPTKLLDQLRR